jgi:hypothetical protein
MAAPATPRWLLAAGGIGLIVTLTLVLAAVWLRSSSEQKEQRSTEEPASSDQPAVPTTSDSTVVQAAQPDAAVQVPQAAPAEKSAVALAPITPATITTRQAPSARLNAVRPAVQTVAPPAESVASGGQAPALSDAPRPAAVRPPSAASDPAVTVTILETAPPGSQIYSALDADVAAPIAAYPQSSTVATVQHDDEMLIFDVIIDPTGRVESVKPRSIPSSIRSAIMLTMSMSVAKAWRFQPATRQGRSVRYRQSIAVPVRRQ